MQEENGHNKARRIVEPTALAAGSYPLPRRWERGMSTAERREPVRFRYIPLRNQWCISPDWVDTIQTSLNYARKAHSVEIDRENG
jgi:hypothetical protein